MDGVIDTKLRIEVASMRLLQDKVFKKAVSEEDYNKVVRFAEKLRASDLKNDEKIEVFDVGSELIFEKVNKEA